MNIKVLLYSVVFLFIFTNPHYSDLLDLSFLNLEKKELKTPMIKHFYIHNRGIKIVKGKYYVQENKNDEYEIIIIMSCNNSNDIRLTNSEKLDDEYTWNITLKTDTRNIKPLLIEKIEEKNNYENFFGKKSIRFGNLYKIYWNPSKDEIKNEIVISHGIMQFSLPIEII